MPNCKKTKASTTREGKPTFSKDGNDTRLKMSASSLGRLALCRETESWGEKENHNSTPPPQASQDPEHTDTGPPTQRTPCSSPPSALTTRDTTDVDDPMSLFPERTNTRPTRSHAARAKRAACTGFANAGGLGTSAPRIRQPTTPTPTKTRPHSHKLRTLRQLLPPPSPTTSSIRPPRLRKRSPRNS